MTWLLILASVAVLLLAPLRQAFFRVWFFTIPALAGLVLAFVMLHVMKTLNPYFTSLPPWSLYAIAVMVALEAGFVGMGILLSHIGSSRDRKS